jgi:alpha-N-arabinofuranosidase
MLLTPTYHVYDLYKVHQDATLIPLKIQSQDYAMGTDKLKALNASASKDQAGNIHITVVNIDPNKAIDLQLEISGIKSNSVSAQIITSAKFTDHNTFGMPGTIKPTKFDGVKKGNNGLTAKLPAKSIVLITLAP